MLCYTWNKTTLLVSGVRTFCQNNFGKTRLFLVLVKQERAGMRRSQKWMDLGIWKSEKPSPPFVSASLCWFFSPTANRFFPYGRRNGYRAFQTHSPSSTTRKGMCSLSDLIKNKSQGRSLITLPFSHCSFLSQAMTHSQTQRREFCALTERTWVALPAQLPKR